MNVITWAREVLKDNREETLEGAIDRLRRSCDPGFFQRDDVQFQFWKWLVRDAKRALKVPSVPVEPEEYSDDEQPRLVERIFRSDDQLSESDVRRILKECRESIGQNMAKGKRYMALALRRGWKTLRDEYPEFDPAD